MKKIVLSCHFYSEKAGVFLAVALFFQSWKKTTTKTSEDLLPPKKTSQKLQNTWNLPSFWPQAFRGLTSSGRDDLVRLRIQLICISMLYGKLPQPSQQPNEPGRDGRVPKAGSRERLEDVAPWWDMGDQHGVIEKITLGFIKPAMNSASWFDLSDFWGWRKSLSCIQFLFQPPTFWKNECK